MEVARRRAVAAAASALLAVALAVAIAGRGCQAEDETPDGVVRAFSAAARAGDRDAVYGMLGPGTRAALAQRARRATELVGGSRRFEPTELISVGARGVGTRPPVDFVVRERDGKRAMVDIVGADGSRTPIDVVRVGGAWRIELPRAKLRP